MSRKEHPLPIGGKVSPNPSISTSITLDVLDKLLQNGAKFIQKLTPGFKNHMRNLDNFRQAVESPKSSNSMGYICPKNAFLQLKPYIQRIYLTLLSTTCVKIHQTPYIIFYDTTCLYIVAQTLHTFDKNIPSKFKFSDFPLPELKFIKFLMSFFKQKVSPSSKCGSLFSVMRDNSSALF